MSRRRLLYTSLLFAISLQQFASAGNWPQWRGAKLDGISSEKNLPTKWSSDDNIAWKIKLPGAAGATPCVWGKRIFLTSVSRNKLLLMCITTDGNVEWTRQMGEGNRKVRRDEGNTASPSPSTDGKHVWAMMANGIIGCYTVTGDPVWKFNLQKRYGRFRIAFGMTATPVLDNNRLYVQLIHGEGNPTTREAIVVALNAKTGAEIWKHDRASDAIKECEHSYASPILYRDKSREFLLTHGADFLIAHSLKDGHELWRCGDLNPKGGYNPTLRFVASPVAAPGMIVVPSAKNGPVFALKPNGKGDITEKESTFIWRRAKGTPDVPSPIIHKGLVYLCRENGNLVCVDAKTGRTLYNRRTTRDRHRASPVLADGKIYTTARNGTVTVAKIGREFKILAQNKLGEPIAASPAVSNGRIYLRTFKHLYAIGK